MQDANNETEQTTDVTGALARHRGWLRSVIAARLGDPSGVDDVLQDVNVAAIEQKSPLRDHRAVTVWLYQLTIRQIRQFRRRLGRQRNRTRDAARSGSGTEHEAGDPLAWLLTNERRVLIREALSRLSGKDREVLILKYVEGWSCRRIAEQTNRTERAVESRLHRARVRMRDLLARLDVVEKRENS